MAPFEGIAFTPHGLQAKRDFKAWDVIMEITGQVNSREKQNEVREARPSEDFLSSIIIGKLFFII